MQVTRAVDYGLRALVIMSRKPLGARFFLQELADEGQLPRNYLVKVLKSMANVGIVQSHRGIKGGFTLAKEPQQITLRQVIESIDGPVTVMHCLAEPHACAHSGHCAVEVYFQQLRAQILMDMETKTLKEIVDMQCQMDKAKTCPAPCPTEKSLAGSATA